MSTQSPFKTELHIAQSKDDIPETLFHFIKEAHQQALNDSSEFHIALSGGSLPSLLTSLPRSFADANIDPQWDKWRVILADERLVPSSHPDSNLKALKDSLLDRIPIPSSQIYGIDESLLHQDNTSDTTVRIAEEYEKRVFGPFSSGSSSTREYLVDCVLLGFGPDGHTASLFPNHELLRDESGKLVLGISDSPKPPSNRITLSLHCLNRLSRNVVFVGAGESKAPILRGIFSGMLREENELRNTSDKVKRYNVELKHVRDQTYPCGMIRPKDGKLVYITDASGASELSVGNQQCFCSLL